MNTNYYTNIINRTLKSQFVFVSLMSAFLFSIFLKEVQEIFLLKDLTYVMDIGKGITKTLYIEEALFIKIVLYYKIVLFITTIALVNNIYERFLKRSLTKEKEVRWYDVKTIKYPFKKDKLELIIGKIYNEENLELNEKPKYLKILEDGLFQNILITGTIGTGKTIALMSQILVQLIFKFHDDEKKKFAMLCLDVKGNFHKFVYAFAKEVKRWNDVITIEIGGVWKYNPLHKPNLSEIELANRCRYVLELFQGKGVDSYWLGKAEDFMVELFKLIRLYNNGYINFEETHKCGLDEQYRNKVIEKVNAKLKNEELTEEQEYNFKTIVSYFKNEYDKQDEKIQGFIISSLTTMTQPFISTKKMRDSFSPSEEEINFFGFEETIKKGKIVVFKINANKEPKVAKLIAAYLKLDMQKETMISLDKGKNSIEAQRVKVIVSDECQEYATRNDAEYLSQSREPRSITVSATQSYSSIKQALNNDETITNMLLQSYVNKIWLRSDDVDYTIPKVIKQIGKVLREKISTSVTENAQKSRTNFSLGKILGSGKNLSSGISISEQMESKFDEVFLGQRLKAGQAVAFISDGEEILPPTVVHCVRMHKDGRIIFDESKNTIRFTTDKEEIFKEIGEIDIDKLEQGLTFKLDEKDKIHVQEYVKKDADNIKHQGEIKEAFKEPQIASESNVELESINKEIESPKKEDLVFKFEFETTINKLEKDIMESKEKIEENSNDIKEINIKVNELHGEHKKVVEEFEDAF